MPTVSSDRQNKQHHRSTVGESNADETHYGVEEPDTYGRLDEYGGEGCAYTDNCEEELKSYKSQHVPYCRRVPCLNKYININNNCRRDYNKITAEYRGKCKRRNNVEKSGGKYTFSNNRNRLSFIDYGFCFVPSRRRFLKSRNYQILYFSFFEIYFNIFSTV